MYSATSRWLSTLAKRTLRCAVHALFATDKTHVPLRKRFAARYSNDYSDNVGVAVSDDIPVRYWRMRRAISPSAELFTEPSCELYRNDHYNMQFLPWFWAMNLELCSRSGEVIWNLAHIYKARTRNLTHAQFRYTVALAINTRRWQTEASSFFPNITYRPISQKMFLYEERASDLSTLPK